MAAEIPNPGPGLHAPSTRTSVDAAPTMIPESPQKSVEDLTVSNNSTADMERAQEKADDAPVVDELLVVFNGPDDPDNPKNWTARRRWGITVVVGLLVFSVTFASSIFSVNIGIVEDKFQVTQVVATLGVALFVLVRKSPLCSRAGELTQYRASCSVLSHSVPCRRSSDAVLLFSTATLCSPYFRSLSLSRRTSQPYAWVAS